MAKNFDIKTARDAFPALKKSQVFFDNAGGSQVLGSVVEKISNYLIESNVQLGATYEVGTKATASYSAGNTAAAKYINASEEDIVLGASTTQLYRNLSYALKFSEGDEIILSGIDHEANIASWLGLAERQKLKVTWWIPSSKTNPILHAEELKNLLSEKTKIVAITQVSNILGTIHDIPAISKVVHEAGALLGVDAVAYAPHREIDVQALGVDFYTFSWYKVYGPHISLLYASKEGQKCMQSLGHYFNSSQTVTDKIGLGAGSYELVASIPAVVEYFGSDPKRAWKAIEAHEQELSAILLQYLISRDDVTIFGVREADSTKRVPTISFGVKGWDSKTLVETVEKKTNFGFRWGAFYSNRLCDFMGLGKSGVVRVSMVHYNTLDEIHQFVAALDKVLSK